MPKQTGLPIHRHFDCMKRCQNGDLVCSTKCKRLPGGPNSGSAVGDHEPLASLYDGRDHRDGNIFAPVAKHYHPPARFSHGGWHLVVELPKEQGDGHPVRIYESRMPARFFKVEVLEAPNSVGKSSPGFTLSTGSGDEMGKLCVQIALAAQAGMLGLHHGQADLV